MNCYGCPLQIIMYNRFFQIVSDADSKLFIGFLLNHHIHNWDVKMWKLFQVLGVYLHVKKDLTAILFFILNQNKMFYHKPFITEDNRVLSWIIFSRNATSTTFKNIVPSRLPLLPSNSWIFSRRQIYGNSFYWFTVDYSFN